MEFKDGSSFEGNFYEDFPYGKGKMAFANGDRYEGNYEEGEISGYGVYIHNGETAFYEGDFRGS